MFNGSSTKPYHFGYLSLEGITSCKVDMGSAKHVQTAPGITLKVVLRLRYMDNPGDILVRPTIYEPWDDPLG